MTARVWFVTGANGFVGRRLCHALLADNQRVKALVRGAGEIAPELNGAEIVRADIFDSAGYASALGDVDIIVHAAGNAKFGNGAHYVRENVESTAVLIEAAKHAPKLTRFVYISTIGAVDRAAGDPISGPISLSTVPSPKSDYGRSKLEAEALVAKSGLPYAIVRPCMVVGSDMRADSHMAVMSRMASQGGLLSRFALPGAFSVIHDEDLCSAIVTAATSEQAADRVFFAAGSPVAVKELFAWTAPQNFRFPVAWAAALAKPLLRFMPFSIKAILYPALTADDGDLRALGWTPRRSARDSLEEVIARERSRCDWRAPPPGRTIITGAASGLGRAFAEILAATGRSLLLIDKDGPLLQGVATNFADVERVCLDLGDKAALDSFLASDAYRSRPVAEIFACAGYGLRGSVATLSADKQVGMMDVNVSARIRLACAALADMRRQGWGRIVLTSSSSAFQALPFMSVYAASNAALLSFGEGLAAEEAGNGIEVLTVCPGGMATAFQDAAGVKKVEGEKLMTPEAVAEVALKNLGRNRILLPVSARSRAMLQLARVLPRKVSLALWTRLMTTLR